MITDATSFGTVRYTNMTAKIIQFPTLSFFVEKCDFEHPFECDQIKLEAKTRDAAQREADAIAENYGWAGWVVYDDRQQIVNTPV
jgi:hypothetical protein